MMGRKIILIILLLILISGCKTEIVEEPRKVNYECIEKATENLTLEELNNLVGMITLASGVRTIHHFTPISNLTRERFVYYFEECRGIVGMSVSNTPPKRIREYNCTENPFNATYCWNWEDDG